MAPGTEAPAEMLMYFAMERRCARPRTPRNVHNLYTIRGAQVRDANQWWRAQTSSSTASAHVPRCCSRSATGRSGAAELLVTYLGNQRDGYKYIHDQSLRLANQGLCRPRSRRVKLPPSLASQWDLRDYYGTVNHNAKAVYQRYLGWYDGNPANLYPLPRGRIGPALRPVHGRRGQGDRTGPGFVRA
ncbi:alkyl sulfatase dimerization domain-containing protein [Cupriavidus basilensis]